MSNVSFNLVKTIFLCYYLQEKHTNTDLEGDFKGIFLWPIRVSLHKLITLNFAPCLIVQQTKYGIIRTLFIFSHDHAIT